VGNDAQDGPITAVCVPPSGSTFAVTTTTVNCTVTDSGGLTATGSFTVTVTPLAVAPISVTGGAFFMHDGYQEKVQLDVAVSPSGVITGGNSLKYYYTRTRMNLVSTQILTVVVTGHTATLTGLATVNGVAGYTFTLTMTDGPPDAFGITVRRADGSVYYTYSQAASGGDLIIH